MSVIQVEDLVSYQLRTNYLNDIADGVGERLFTLNEGFLNSAPFKSAGWRPNPALIKRTHSPPIPTAVASEYFQAPQAAALTLEDEGDETGMFGGGGTDTVGPGMATKRRRRREQMEEDDSSDLSDESDDEPEQRAAQKISFSKMPLRTRSGSSPIQSSNLRQATNVSSPRAPPPRRGSQSALETVKERARRDTVTSSEVSSDNEFDASGFHKAREAARAAERAAKMSVRMNTEPTMGIKRQESDLLEEEDDDDDSDGSDGSSAFVGGSLDSTSLLQVVDQHLNASPTTQVVGTPPRDFTRRSTIRNSAMPAPLQISMGDLPPPRPMSTIRPMSMIQPKSLISAALNANKTKPNLPFVKFASLSGQGDPNPLRLRIFAPFSTKPSRPFEVLIRRSVHEGESSNRTVTVADLIGLSLWRYNEEKLEPSLPSDKLNVNWWTLRMVEEDGEVDDDFPPLERKKPLTSFTTANNRAGRARSNSAVYDIFALVQASSSEFADNQSVTPEYGQEQGGGGGDDEEEDVTPKNTPKPDASKFEPVPPKPNPLLKTFWHGTTVYADVPTAPQQPAPTRSAAARGEKKLLRIHMHSTDLPPGQMVTLDVTTDRYLQEILEEACRKRQLDVASHVLKFPGSGLVVPLDQPVASIGSVADLDLYRRRFGTDGVLTMTGSGSPSSSSPRILGTDNSSLGRARKRVAGPHPLAQEALVAKDLGLDMSYKKYTVNRRGRMRMGLTDTRSFSVDGEYIHITDANGKKSTIHFSSVLGCKVSRKHPTQFKFTVYRDPREPNKVYDFEARNAEEATEIVARLQKGIAPYRDT
ncbi:SIN1-domain-containing protein [Thozetella sp. PMI_491]|nr:SIN1-domain-containing protein [Thozetella sp. PMI_491]